MLAAEGVRARDPSPATASVLSVMPVTGQVSRLMFFGRVEAVSALV